jgi:hypothetical protein
MPVAQGIEQIFRKTLQDISISGPMIADEDISRRKRVF